MAEAKKFPSLYPCPIEEAKSLVQRCAEPRPVGDSVKAAINRAAKRLSFTTGRTKALWYGEAGRIDAREMDRLRRCAARTDFDQAIAGMKVLRNRLAMVGSPKCRELVDAIDEALYSGTRERSTHPSALQANETADHDRIHHHDQQQGEG